jgi:hypothetical protein
VALPSIPGRAPQTPATTQPGGADARTAAQRAFFQAALEKTGAVAQPATPARTESRTVQPTVSRLKDETTIPPHPGRILRPGSIIDIKV